MSRIIYLIRHSYAEESNGKRDVDRKLTLEGQSTVRALGRHLINQNFNPDIILCSSAVRTQETAVNLVEELGMNEGLIEYKDVIYNASVREMLEVLNELSEETNSVAIIGHNPTITFFGEYLSGSIIGNMEPSGVATIKFDKLNWGEVSQGTGIFVNYYHPNY